MIKSQIQLQLSSLINRSQIPWWIEIRTTLPSCTYFFGPFDNFKEARRSQDGYIEDLVTEKAFGITVEIKQCRPNLLTVFEEFYSSRIRDHCNIQPQLKDQNVELNFCDDLEF